MSNKVNLYAEFDGMPTEYLRTLLSLDISATSGVELDPDAILHILEVIQSREAADGSADPVDVAAAWKDFNEKYRPAESEVEGPVPICIQAKGRRHLRLKRVCVTLAAVIAIAIGSMAVANAAGFDLWGAVVQWASETFGLENSMPYFDGAIGRKAKPCSDLHDALSTDGITDPLVPTWLPDGFTQYSCDKSGTPQMTTYQASYKNGEQIITIQVFAYVGGVGATHTFERLPKEYSTSVLDGVTYYIAVNSDGSAVALWNTDTCECSISGNITETEMKQIIDSIYRG